MSGFTEVGERCWVARYPWMDVNVSLVAGERGLLAVDTYASSVLARQVLDDVRRISAAPILAAMNTHVHFDHTFGNGVFADAGADLIAHENAAAGLLAHAAEVKESATTETAETGDGRLADLVATEVVVPTRTFSSVLAVDLGDRVVELIHPGRGHTDGDLVVRVPDADVLLAGDLIEESADREGVPGFGDDCWVMEWPATLDLVLGLAGEQTVVVPGHGAPVDREFVSRQRDDIATVAETIRDLAGRGVPAEDALTAAEWPFPAELLATACRRGYEALGPRRSLPVIGQSER